MRHLWWLIPFVAALAAFRVWWAGPADVGVLLILVVDSLDSRISSCALGGQCRLCRTNRDKTGATSSETSPHRRADTTRALGAIPAAQDIGALAHVTGTRRNHCPLLLLNRLI
jgi:hypothetical protein